MPQQYALSDVFDSFEMALDSQPHAAVICTPAHLHVPMATELARRGIHILMEKPVSTSLDGINELVATVAQNNVVVAGIGCSGNMVHLLDGDQPYGIHGIHGRALPIARGSR